MTNDTRSAAAPTSDLDSQLQALVGQPLGEPATARDPVNQPMIRHWCDAMGDELPVYTDPAAAAASIHGGIVAPPAMLQVWNMQGLRRRRSASGVQARLMSLLDEAGYTSVVATNSEQVYHRYLRPGDLLVEDSSLESVSPLKRTALGEGYFVDTVRRYCDQSGQLVGEMKFRILKFRPGSGRTAAATAAAPTAPAATQAPTAPGAPAPPASWPRPAINRDTAFFWEGTRQGELRIQRCRACGLLRHPPSPFCPSCRSNVRDWLVAEGAGILYSYVVHHYPPVPPLTTPFVVGLVELPEGTRIVGNVLEVDPATVEVGMALEVTFVPVDDDLVLPQWRPSAKGAHGD